MSQFLRPSYFLPLLKKQSQAGILRLENNKNTSKNHSMVFDNIDVIANVFLTAAKRDDRQLMRLVMGMLHECLEFMLSESISLNLQWRDLFRRY